MHDCPETEARQLLAPASQCPPCTWRPSRGPGQRWTLQCGLLTPGGAANGLVVSLSVHVSAETGLRRQVHSVFQTSQWGLQRVYQLDTRNWPRMPRDAHQWPHQHWGSLRQVGDAAWAAWAYSEALGHFLAATNIQFEEPPPDPLEFRLVGQ